MAQLLKPMIPIRFNKENFFPSISHVCAFCPNIQLNPWFLNLGKFILGRGQFGISYMFGKITIPDSNIEISHPSINTSVLFKSATKADNEKCFKALLRELNILECINHSCILNLVGICVNELKNGKLVSIYHQMSHGICDLTSVSYICVSPTKYVLFHLWNRGNLSGIRNVYFWKSTQIPSALQSISWIWHIQTHRNTYRRVWNSNLIVWFTTLLHII